MRALAALTTTGCENPEGCGRVFVIVRGSSNPLQVGSDEVSMFSLIEGETGQLKRTFVGRSRVVGVAFVRDDGRIVAG